jgi:gamma-glutamylcyclotransferase (GGCT)/AIG2-like uncharacterized protein YtfP
MAEVFVYATLEDKHTDYKALGHNLKGSKDAELYNWTKKVYKNGYDTIYLKPNGKVKGKLLVVSDEDLKKLDDWEDRYNRVEIANYNDEPVYAYRLKEKFMPWKSQQQQKWGNSPAGKQAMGQNAVNEFNKATAGKALPQKLSLKPKLPKLNIKPKGILKSSLGM